MQVLEHITAETVERYCRRELQPAELLAAQRHAAGCEPCRVRLERAVDAESAFASLRAGLTAELLNLEDEPKHLPYEQLAAYLDGALDEVDREIAESHFAVCRQCADDLADLRHYQAIDAPPATTLEPSGEAATAKSFWQRLKSFNPLPSSGMLVPAAAAAAVVAVVLAGVWVAVQKKQEAGGEVARVNPPKGVETAPTPGTADPNSAGAPHSAAYGNQSQTEGQGGKATVTPSPSSPSTTQQLRVGDAPPPLVFTLDDGGGQVAFDNRGNLRGLEGLPASVRQAVRRSLETQRVQTPRGFEALAGAASGVLMSEGAASGVPFALVSPVGRVVREQRPVLRWRPLAGAKHYTVAIVDAKFRVVAQSPALNATQWTPPGLLPRGATYSWQVTAATADGGPVTSPTSPAPQARFRVLDESTSDDLKLLEKAGTDSHLVRGVLFARAGLLEEARAELEELVRLNPRSPIARRLLESVRRK